MMANWGVALAQRPMVPGHKRKKARHAFNSHLAESPSLLAAATSDVMLREPPYQRYGNVFKHLCNPEEGEHNCEKQGCERITINVSGLQFVTKRSVLDKHPNTLLGKWNKVLKH